MIPFIRDNLHDHNRMIWIGTFFKKYLTMAAGGSGKLIIVFGKVCRDRMISSHEIRIGIFIGNSISRCICPFFKIQTVSRGSRQYIRLGIKQRILIAGYGSIQRIIRLHSGNVRIGYNFMLKRRI
ncbi:hypothetical protein Barb7_02385 [Bacteroidales bacterium Barb7]|nr:hypothetical protein Barb7_02385 [Bacteroidales bacterium Barb7]